MNKPPVREDRRFCLERAMRFELTTLTLARLCSTPELRPLCARSTSPSSKPVQAGIASESEANVTACELEEEMAGGQEKRHPDGCLFTGAGDEIRTHDPNLGKVMLYP